MIKMWLAKYKLPVILAVSGVLSTLWLYEKVQRVIAEGKVTSLTEKVTTLEANVAALKLQAESVSEGNKNIIEGLDVINQDFSGIVNELDNLLINECIGSEIPYTPTLTPPPPPVAVKTVIHPTPITNTPSLPPREIVLAWDAYEIAKKAGVK